MRDSIYNRSFAPDAEQRRQDADETRGRALALRRTHEVATAELRGRLPFSWTVGKVRPKYQGPPVWERGPAALHIQLSEPVVLDGGQRPAGDWLCSASLDVGTGELRYEPEPDLHQLQHCDGTGGSASYYLPAPTCKKCLAKALKLFPAADGKS